MRPVLLLLMLQVVFRPIQIIIGSYICIVYFCEISSKHLCYSFSIIIALLLEAFSPNKTYFVMTFFASLLLDVPDSRIFPSITCCKFDDTCSLDKYFAKPANLILSVPNELSERKFYNGWSENQHGILYFSRCAIYVRTSKEPQPNYNSPPHVQNY